MGAERRSTPSLYFTSYIAWSVRFPPQHEKSSNHLQTLQAAITSKMSRLLDWYHDQNDKEYLQFVLSQETMADHHIYHCIDYIRQSIMCNGDPTLEKARTGDDGKPARGVDGWGVGHECRNFDAIFEFAAERRTRNISGID